VSSGTICASALWHEARSEDLGGNDVFFLTLFGFGLGALAAYLLVKVAKVVKQAKSHSEDFMMLAPLTFMQPLAWVCLVLGIGSGALIAAVAIRVLTLEVFVTVSMLIPAVAFAGCSWWVASCGFCSAAEYRGSEARPLNPFGSSVEACHCATMRIGLLFQMPESRDVSPRLITNLGYLSVGLGSGTSDDVDMVGKALPECCCIPRSRKAPQHSSQIAEPDV
jgi:hypothetical protein